MVTRRRAPRRRLKKTPLSSPVPPEGEGREVLQVSVEPADPVNRGQPVQGEPEGEQLVQDKPAREQPSALSTSLPVAVILEILAREYSRDTQGEALCRTAVSIVEESGLLEHYRAIWEAEETNLSGKQSYLLFERRQSLDLINYHRSKNNQPALEKELAHLRLIEGRLLLGAAQPTGITDEDLAKLEEFIKYSGF